MKIVTDMRSVVRSEYMLKYALSPDEGYAFPCDKDGNVYLDRLTETAYDNLIKCQDGTYDVDGPVLVHYEFRHTASALGRCDCGELVILDSFVNVCPGCAKEYSISGQLMTEYKEAV